ncbi:recombinase family protein [Streptomyces albidoflavus]
MAVCLRRSGLMSDGLTTATLLRRLRNPALLGHRVEEDKTREGRRSRSVLDASGKPIRVAPAIFTDEEFADLQEALDRRAKRQPPRPRGASTRTYAAQGAGMGGWVLQIPSRCTGGWRRTF